MAMTRRSTNFSATPQAGGKEAALFLPTGTQANLVALLSHCERGEEYIVGQGAHNYLYEAGGAAVLGSIQPQPIDAAPDGSCRWIKSRQKSKPTISISPAPACSAWKTPITAKCCRANTESGVGIYPRAQTRPAR
jgi:threonine aldolase